MLTPYLIAFVVALLVNIRRDDRLITIVPVMIVNLAHTILFDNEQNAFVYFGTAAMADCLTIILIQKRDSLALDLQVLFLMSEIINMLGYLGYESGISTIYYNSTMRVLFLFQILRMLWGSRLNDHNQGYHLFGLVRLVDIIFCKTLYRTKAKEVKG